MSSNFPLPNVDESLPPQLHQMGEYKFQRLTTDLLGYEPGIATSTEYGVRGQADHGVDVIGRRMNGDGQEVASCKCYLQTSAGQMRGWSDEFLEHWDDHWHTQDVRRFVLATTATNVASRAIQDQVTVERARFAKLGIAYEVWGPTVLIARLRPHRHLAANYLGAIWADILCGSVAGALGLTTAPSTGLVSAALINQVADLQARLSAQALRAAERAHEDLRAGRTGAVRTLIDEQRRSENWIQLEPHVQAKLLRLAGSLALLSGDVDLAEQEAAAADAIELQEEPRLAAHIELERSGPQAALSLLGDVTSPSGLQLRIALCVMAGDVEGAAQDLVRLLHVDAADPESVRMEALVALASGRPHDALAPIRRAELLAPERSAVRQLGAMVRYACALSPMLPPEWYLSPNAFDGAFVREDALSQALLVEALGLLDHLVAAEPEQVHHRIWRLAVLASIRSARERAREEARELLVRSHNDATVVAWCLFRGIDVDLAASEQVLLERYATGTDQTTVQVLGLLLTRGDNATEAVDRLRASLDKQVGDSRTEAETWIERLQAAQEGRLPADAPAFAQAREDGDWRAVGALLEEQLASSPPNPSALGLAEGLAAEGRFDLLAAHIDAILSFRTATAVRLAAMAALRSGDGPLALSILDAEAVAFGESLPPDIRRLRANVLLSTGDVSAALREADIVASTGSTRDRLFRAELMTATGNTRGAVAAVREALESGLIRGNQAFRWSRALRSEEPALARRLLERAIDTDLDDRLAAAAMHDAFQLQLGSEADALVARVHARAVEGASDVRILTAEDLPAMLAGQQALASEREQMYFDGAVPVHLALSHDPVEFALLHLGPNVNAAGCLRAWPIRHGGRPGAVEYSTPWSDWRLHLDISGLLVAARLELLDALDFHPQGVAIPADAPLLLLAMETGCRERTNASVAERVLAADLKPTGLDDIQLVRVVADTKEGAAADELQLGGLLEALVAHGAIDADIADRITTQHSAAYAILPPNGAALLLEIEPLRQLAGLDLLPALSARYDLYCKGSVLDQAARAREEADTALAVADMLSKLRNRVAAGLEAGNYRLMPRATLAAENGVGEETPESAPLVRCLADTIAAAGLPGAIAWIDDRLITGYAQTSAMPVVGVCDVLEALRREGRIDVSRRDTAVASLRAAGALYLVPSADEILIALRAAPSNGQSVVETPALAELRRSLAHVALNERHLAMGGGRLQDRPDEVIPVQMAMRLLANLLKEIWLDDRMDFDRRIALSDWTWLNARRTHVGRVLPNENPEVSQNGIEVIQIAHCLDQAFDVGLPRDVRREVRLSYLQWVWLRAVEPLAEVDPDFMPRLVRYLADLYGGMDKKHRFESRRNHGILHLLLALRVQRLPDPVQTQLYRDPRMASFGKSIEYVSVRGANFEAEAFWRAARRALRYGSARARVVSQKGGRAKVARFNRDGVGLVITGAVRARLNQDTLSLAALDGGARKTAIEALVANLMLEPAVALEVRNKAVAARSLRATLRIINDAAAVSAASRYQDLAAKLARREAFGLDLLLPAPFAAVLATIGVEDTSGSFGESVAEIRQLKVELGSATGLIEAAGIPVLWSSRAFDEGSLRAACERARTPMALVQVAAAARSLGWSADDLSRVVERFVSTVENFGPLFIALLRWTYKASIRDPAWRSAPQPWSLAAVWLHADRLLDILSGWRVDVERLRIELERNEPEVSGVDLLELHSGPPDVAQPSWLSPAALLHHGLAAIFKDDDIKRVLGSSLIERLINAQLAQTAEVVAPEAKLLLRRDDWPNAMGSFLFGSPHGLGDVVLERSRTRELLVDKALDAIESEPNNQAGWQQLSAFAVGGVNELAGKRLAAIISRDPARLVRLVAAGMSPVLWRATLQPIGWIDAGLARALMRDVALACRHWHESRGLHAGAVLTLDDVAVELVEVAALLSACGEERGTKAFAAMIVDLAHCWPALRPILHQVVGNLVARTPSGRANSLWELMNQLGSC